MALIALIYMTVWWLVIGSFLGLPILLIMLCVPAWRRPLLRHPRKLGALTLVATSVVGVTTYQILSSYQENLRRNPTLDHAEQIEGLDLPAGTRLHLKAAEPLEAGGQPQAQALASLEAAEFGAPHTVMGLRVSALQMYGSDEANLKLVGNQTVDGWPCAGASWVVARFNRQARLRPELWRFSRCELVPGTHIAGVDWPADSQVLQRDVGYSVSHYGTSPAITLDGLALKNVSVRLDAQRGRLHWEGQLRTPMTLGDWHYPEGMRVGQIMPYTLVFRADGYYTGRNLRTGEGLAPGHSIEQHVLDGAELWIKPDSEVEGFDR
ncbi:hypothetical protein [Pseudomonas sp. NPDC089534]|uniref:hypothetical protein n=1 Tax=Pseudomonas sp. NPDC089534 TaxID=3364468 RepID=UPI0037FDC9E5